MNEILARNDIEARTHQQRIADDRNPDFERVNNLTTEFLYPNVPPEMAKPVYNIRSGVTALNLWLKFVPTQLLQKI